MNIAVILCGGTGSRMNQELPKQFIEINSKPLFQYSIEAFLNEKIIDYIVLVINKQYENLYQKYLNELKYRNIFMVYGGDSRQKSVENAINFLKNKISSKDLVLIHDGARPLIDSEIINSNIMKCHDTQNPVLTCVSVVDTIMDKEFNLLNRDQLIAAQTPQTFRFEQLEAIHEFAKEKNIISASDDIQLAKAYGLNISLVSGTRKNLKVTEKEDLEIIKLYLKSR